VLVIVPAEEVTAPAERVFLADKPLGIGQAVLHYLELCLRKGTIVGVYGREWLLTAPRSIIKWATVFDRIALPRSEGETS
jgi:hypothetical protein